MPIKMCGYIQSVVMQGRLYVGGGYTGLDKGNIVMEYDVSSREWATLLPYRAKDFAMTVINNQLVLVGGWDHGGFSKLLGVWGADYNEWVHPFPEMPTAHSRSSVVVYKEWLVTAGGWADGNALVSCVEVLNTESKQWYAGPSTLIPWYGMKTAVVGDIGYFMGGCNIIGCASIKTVYSVCISTLISQITSKASSGTDREIWKEIPGLQLIYSTPLSFSGSLLAVGGWDKDRNATTAIHRYQPDTGEWVKVGDLPSPRYKCTCVMTTDREVFVAGGEDKPHSKLTRVDFTLA